MNHLDEGTIHAWLDGELDAARASEVQAHVTSCAQCSALVAEARGFVAGASRILTALDDVPAGVTPKRAAGPAWGPRAKRQWRAAPWVTGIAAALILTVGIATWRRNPEVPISDGKPIRTLTVPVFDSTVAAARDQREAAAAQASGASSSIARAPQEGARLQSTATGGAGVASGAGAPSRAAARPDAPKAAADVSDALAKKELQPQALAAPSAAVLPPPPVAPTARLEVKDAPPSERDVHALDVAAAGCYRIDQAAIRRSVAEDVKRAASKAPAPMPTSAGAAAPRALTREPEFDMSLAPRAVQLDTTASPMGFVVRAMPDGERLGFWFRVGADSVRVDMLARGAYTIARTARVNCQE